MLWMWTSTARSSPTGDSSHSAERIAWRENALPGMPREVQQDAVLGGGEVQRLPEQLHLPRERVDLEVADLDAGLLGGPAFDAAQDRLDAAHELARGERLGDVVVGAELEAEDAVDLVAARGQHDDGDVGGGAQVRAMSSPDLPGKHDVEDDEVGLDLVEDELGARAVDARCGPRSRPRRGRSRRP